MDHLGDFNLKDLLPQHTRLIPRLHPDLTAYSAGLPPSWQAALQDPGDPGQAAARIWQPARTRARGLVFRLENITLDLGLVVSDTRRLPPYLLYICEYNHSLHGWLAGIPAEDHEILLVEKTLGIQLPVSYRSFLQIHNGFFETEHSEIGFSSLKQAYLISFEEISAPQEPNMKLLAFSTDRVGQLHAYNLNYPNGQGDFMTVVWDSAKLSLGQPKSFWSYLKDFSIHSLR